MLDLLGACDSEPKQPNAILNLIVIFPLACPKSQKQQKRNPPTPQGGFLFGTFSLWMFSHMQRPSLLHRRVLEKQRNQDTACFMRAWHAPLCFILNVQHLNIWQRWNVHGDLHQQWMANLSTKSGLSYETSCFGAMIKSKQATKVYFPAMVFKKWEQDCTLVNMLVTLLHLHQREQPTHTQYNHFSTLQKMPDAKKNNPSQHGRRARREKLGGIQHPAWRCPINCCDAFVHGSKDKTFVEGTRAPWQYSFAH